MGWYFRKSVTLGPVRFNLSKGGIGTSFGIKGFRVGVRPNGSSYIHAGSHGVYYRQELSTPSQTTNKKYQDIECHAHDSDTIKYQSASSQELKSTSRSKLIDELNKSYKDLRIDYLCGLISIIFSIIFWQENEYLGTILLFIGIILTIAFAVWETKRRTVSIEYEFDNNNGENYKKIIESFNILSKNSNIWALIDSRNIYNSHESKLNAGAGNLINRSNVQIGEGKPPWVKTNIDIPVMKAREQTLYMLPDGILVYDSNDVGFVEYNEITITQGTTNFIEDHPPKDSEILYYTWKHPNKNGGPDRRFKNNYQIPVCLYGELKVQSKSGMFFFLMTSQHEAPKKFKNVFVSIQNFRG